MDITHSSNIGLILWSYQVEMMLILVLFVFVTKLTYLLEPSQTVSWDCHFLRQTSSKVF
jgi:hypothetical protein